MRNHPISHDSKGLSLPIDTGGFFMGINEEERLNDEIAKLFYVVCQRFYISFFDENLLHRIVSDAVSDVQNPSNWTEVPEGGVMA